MSQYDEFSGRATGGRDAGRLFETVRREMRTEVGESSYLAYLQHLKCFGMRHGALAIVADNAVHRDWCRRHVLDRIEKRLAAHGAPERVRFYSREEAPADWAPEGLALAPPPSDTVETSGPVGASDGGPRVLGLPPKPDMTFESFAVGASNHRAATVAGMVARGLGMAFPIVLIHGAPGLGKTHLLHAIANEVIATGQRRKVRLMMAQEFTEEFQAMLHTKRDPAGFKSRMREPDLLLVDDVQRLMGKARTEEEFIDTLLFLQQKGGAQVVLTADHGPDGLGGFEARMRQQLKAATTIEIGAPDRALRRAILDKRLDHYQRHAPDFRVSSAVMDMIAERVTESGRLLDGAIGQLLVEASIYGEEITVEMAEEALRGRLGDGLADTHRITVQQVLRTVAKYYGMEVHEMLKRTRVRSILRPRQVAMYLCTEMTTASLPDIGMRFALPGDKKFDHTTVMHARDLLPKLMAECPKIRRDVEALIQLLKRRP
jgi:chromosomal replication initiator protein